MYPSYHGGKSVSHGRGMRGNSLSGLEHKLPQEVPIGLKSLVHPGEKTKNLLARIGIFSIFCTLPQGLLPIIVYA
jgi:hypothetical protein